MSESESKTDLSEMKYGDVDVSDDDDVERGFKEFDQKRNELYAKWNIGKTPSSIPSHKTPNT